MKDFVLYDDLPLSYAQTCKIAQADGIIPVTRPADILVTALRATVTQCLDRFEPEEGELKLQGVYLYVAGVQHKEYDRDSFGLTTPDVENGTAIIGISVELLRLTRPEFHRIVFFHELAHLCGSMEHDETFQLRLNGIMQHAYGERDTHGDSARAEQLAEMRRKWRM